MQQMIAFVGKKLLEGGMVTGKYLTMTSVVGVEGESIRQYSPVKYEFT